MTVHLGGISFRYRLGGGSLSSHPADSDPGL
jgi:hypothetical protein